jgi:hypothetical protein
MKYEKIYKLVENEVRKSGDLILNIEDFIERVAYATDTLSVEQLSEIYNLPLHIVKNIKELKDNLLI